MYFIYLFVLFLFVLSLSLLSSGFLSFQRAGSTLQLQAFHCTGFSCWWGTGSRCMGFSNLQLAAREHAGLRRCGAQASLLEGTWNLPESLLTLASSALAGRFLSTVPPGKSSFTFLFVCFLIYFLKA